MPTQATYEHDLAISAVAYDTLLVSDVVALLRSRLRQAPIWTGALSDAPEPEVSPLDEDVSRIALVFAQRLWCHDKVTSVDAEVLRDRARRNAKSIIAVSVDGEPLPSWMSRVRHRQLATVGVAGIAAFVLDAIADAGGFVKPLPKTSLEATTEPVPRWPEPPTPFLGQPRAHSALRRELDQLVEELEMRVEENEGDVDRVFELHKLPHRFVARLDDVGVSFSWVPGRSGTVADGRLMVIEWNGVAGRPGAAALQTAHAVRECVYNAEAKDPDGWCWRAEGPNGRASSTANLVGAWIAGASKTSRELASR